MHAKFWQKLNIQLTALYLVELGIENYFFLSKDSTGV